MRYRTAKHLKNGDEVQLKDTGEIGKISGGVMNVRDGVMWNGKTGNVLMFSVVMANGRIEQGIMHHDIE